MVHPAHTGARPQAVFFSPFGAAEGRSCATCRHSIGWDSVHLFCQRARIVPVYPCGHWAREPGAD
ncbi:MAG: hypothetical protein R3357_11295 [Burkholderiales bacterium]|nr:hypothetical protein [Burkholderiales bacterium]